MDRDGGILHREGGVRGRETGQIRLCSLSRDGKKSERRVFCACPGKTGKRHHQHTVIFILPFWENP